VSFTVHAVPHVVPDAVRPAPSPPDPTAAHCERAHAVARRLLGCDHLAADAVQEALIALWRQPVAPADVRGWLLRAVVHRARHLRRTLLRRRRHEHTGSQHCALHAGCDNPLHVAMAHELGGLMTAALDLLPAEQRRVLELFEHAGLDYADIAERLDLPVGTVRSRLARARAAVRDVLRHYPAATP
jgi:RNA polymerase sigma-70 factor (ECF subfamily)